MTEAATTRTIRIGASTIGLIGLDVALNELDTRQLTREEAVDQLFQAIKRKNYIPPGRERDYREALGREYLRFIGLDEGVEQEALVIRIFGPGCVSCNSLQTLVIEVMNQMGVAADVEQIHDPDEIGRAGITVTPALMINGKIKSSGLLPTRAQVEQWIREVVRHD
ncbi:thioredoxin family protein [Desulfolithobacter sp.]